MDSEMSKQGKPWHSGECFIPELGRAIKVAELLTQQEKDNG